MIKLYTDGAFDPKTHQGGIGIQILHDTSQANYKFFVPHVYDNHVIEFMALEQALNLIPHKDETLLIYTDSQILADSIEKAYVKSERYQSHLQNILQALSDFNLYFVHWIEDRQNRGADELARQALRQAGKVQVIED